MLRLIGLIAIFGLSLYQGGTRLAVLVANLLHTSNLWGWFWLVFGGSAAFIFIIARYFYIQAEEREADERMRRKAQGQWPKQPERQDDVIL